MKRLGLLLFALVGCQADAEGLSAASGPASSSSAPLPAVSSPRRTSMGRPSRAELPLLAPNTVRSWLLVVPGDALVEVDGVPVRRRNGVIELIGAVGEVRRVRTFRGSTPGEEKLVTIEAKGTSPALIDANEEKKSEAPKAKPRPVRFNTDE